MDHPEGAAEDLDWERYVKVDPRYPRPSEVDHMLGDPSKARRLLGWEPKVTFHELVAQMVDHDLARQERTLEDAGHHVAQRGTASG